MFRRWKCTFNRKNFIHTSSWSICSNFDEIHCWNMRRSLKSLKLLKPSFFRLYGRSRSLTLVPLESSSAVIGTVSSKSMSICNHLNCYGHWQKLLIAEIAHYKVTLFEHRPMCPKFKLLKFTFNAENLTCRLSRSISSHFDPIRY